MRKKANQTSGAKAIQVFELTMDNPEDQDELNRRLYKPGERDSARKITRTLKGKSRSESAGKKKR